MRKHFRSLRNSLSQTQQLDASERILVQINALTQYRNANVIACYLAQDGEIDLELLIQDAWQQGKTLCLPVLHPFCKGHLVFVKYQQNSKMVTNRFGIPEPKLNVADIVPISLLDIVFTPLVAFDDSAQRLGMGGGFYDRTLAPMIRNEISPQVYGVAHDCQRVDEGLVNEKWDIPMQKIITPSSIFNAS
ncbi:5-formyltetrahydrofolate cyclo-ligase [Paraglaciecola mesophila]